MLNAKIVAALGETVCRIICYEDNNVVDVPFNWEQPVQAEIDAVLAAIRSLGIDVIIDYDNHEGETPVRVWVEKFKEDYSA